jgi:hypothetical protein
MLAIKWRSPSEAAGAGLVPPSPCCIVKASARTGSPGC